MLYREIIAVCSQIHTKHINTLCGQNVEFLGALTEMRKATISFVLSVRVSAWNNSPPLGGFSWGVIFHYLCGNICRENLSFIKIWRE